MNVLAIDIGGSHVKVLATGQSAARQCFSGPTFTAEQMVSDVKQLVADWPYDAVSIGYPGPVVHGRIAGEPHNLGSGWVEFNFEKAFSRPVKVINDAAMQALGSYQGGRMLFLGLGTGLGAALIIDGIIAPLELIHLFYKKGTYEDYLGERGLERLGKKKWRQHVATVATALIRAFMVDEAVIGGGNVHKLDALPPLCRAGDNANAFLGGFRLWADVSANKHSADSTRAVRLSCGHLEI